MILKDFLKCKVIEFEAEIDVIKDMLEHHIPTTDPEHTSYQRKLYTIRKT